MFQFQIDSPFCSGQYHSLHFGGAWDLIDLCNILYTILASDALQRGRNGTDLTNKGVQENLANVMSVGVPFLGMNLTEGVESFHL